MSYLIHGKTYILRPLRSDVSTILVPHTLPPGDARLNSNFHLDLAFLQRAILLTAHDSKEACFFPDPGEHLLERIAVEVAVHRFRYSGYVHLDSAKCLNRKEFLPEAEIL